ncbi:muscle M-line assembly protein unc-89-like [Liolophura sinensis]|uniref:muscle M-line assembly protein unc-89-like n=1 Tax=Liolophura sinensis TaxID=3198878 RepID=UPI003159875B
MPTTITSRPTEAFLGGSKRFKCQVIGNPRPTIRWFKDGIDITNNPRYNFDFTMEGRISMVIPNVTYKDEGCYRCRAENSEGIASTASFLMVRGSVHEQRDEIPTTDVAEMEIEEVYIKKQEEREEYAESFRKRTEKKDRWKRSEVEYTEEMSSSSFQGTVQFESSQSESMTLDHRSWQMESESESETVAKTESDSGFVFEGQSMVIESQVFGKSQELLAELDSDPSLKTKPIFVDNRKRPSDEMEAEDVIELVVQEDTQGQSDEFGESMESEITSQEKEVALFIDESSFEKTEKSDNESLVVSSGETLETVSKSSFTEQSREITMDSNISEVKHGEEKFGVEESASAEMSIKKSSEKESKEMLKQTGKKEENSAEKKLVEESLMSKMKTFREQRDEETEELFIKEESETFVSKKESEVEEKKEKKLTEAEKRELKRKEEVELRKKKREEEEAAMVERMKKFRQQREEEEQVDIFSGVVEEVGESTTVVSEETSSGGVIETSEGKQVQIEEFYSKETTVEGDIELSREKHKVFEFESSVSTQNFEEVTMEEESNEMIIEASVDMDGLGMRRGEEGLKIQADVAIEEIAVQEEEERLNEKNRKLSELHVDTSDIKAEVVESSRDQTKISGEVSTEEISYKSEEAGSFSIETEVVISEEVASTADSRKSWQKESKSEDVTTKKEEEGKKTKPETELDISVSTEVTEKSIPEKDGFKISTEVETEEKHYKESSREETTVIVEERKESVHVDGVAFGEKAELEAKREDLKEADELEGRKAEEKTTNLEMSEKAKVDESLRSKDLERGEVLEQSEAKVREGVLKTDEGTTSKIAEVEGVQKTAEKDVGGVAEAVKVRPKLTAEASVGEDETLLEAVVDVKETQTDRGDVSNGLKEKESVIMSKGVESQAVLADEVKGAETVSVDELSKESLSSTQQADESLTVSKSEREELLSEVLSTSIQSEDVSVMKTETKPEETFATQKDIPGIAEGIKVEQDEYRAGLQEQKMSTEEVVENGDAASAEKTEQLEAASDLGKATKDKPEYRVDAADMASEDVSTLAEEAKVECDILKSEEAEKVSALQTQKSEALASAAEAEKELHVTEDLGVSLKTESADVDGIAEGEKHRATADSGAESKVAESVVEAELKEAREFGQDQETLVESETAAKDKAAKDAVTSQVDEQVQDVEELKKLGPSETAEKAMEVTGEVTVETTIGDQPESKVDVQSSVDSVQFSSELEQKASVDISVVSETSVKESTAEISVTTETSTTDEPLKMTAEVDVSSTKAPEEEVGKLDVLAEIETESKSAEEDTKTLTVDVDVEETPAKLELSASVDIETSQKPDEVTVSAEVDISEPQEEVKVTSEVSMEETAKDIEEEPSQPTTTPPEVVNGPAEISVEVGQTINIEVTLTGFPAPTVSWKKGFKNIEEGKNVKMIANGDVYTLQILNTVVADAGKYRLTASNSEGRTTFDVKVDVVLPKQKDKKEEIEATSQRPEKTAPEVTGPAEISVEMGQTLSVEVTVKGNPAPRVSWYKDDQQVVPNYRKKTTVNGEVYILQILNTVEADAGCYRVTAVNQKGETSCDIKVTVTLPAPPPDTSTGGEDVEASVTLKDKEPDEVTISAEVEVTEKLKDAEKTPMEVTSEVSVEETPAPKEITADVKVEEPPKVTEAPEDVSVEAEVKTTAEVPKHEMAEKVEDVSASVLIKDEPGAKQQEVSAEVDVGEDTSEPAPSSPEVINGPAEISVEVGQTVNIEVTLTGFPAPKVSWKKGFKNIEEGKNVKMIANGDVYTLQILNTVVADTGKYRLTASNSEGRTTFDVKVDVVLPKQKDKKEEIEATPQRPEKTAPEVTGPAEISVEMGQTLAVEVTVRGNPAPRVSWYKDDQQVVPNYRKKTTVNGEVYILQVLNTVEADAGCYRATAVNQKGETSCDIKVTVTLPAPPPDTSTGGEDTETSVTVKDMEPPELSTKPESQSVVEGEPVSLSATVTATTEQKISSGETISMKAETETPDDLFMKAYIMISDHKDAATDFSLKKGETVEVLDTVNKDKWLVRKQADKEKVRLKVIW